MSLIFFCIRYCDSVTFPSRCNMTRITHDNKINSAVISRSAIMMVTLLTLLVDKRGRVIGATPGIPSTTPPYPLVACGLGWGENAGYRVWRVTEGRTPRHSFHWVIVQNRAGLFSGGTVSHHPFSFE